MSVDKLIVGLTGMPGSGKSLFVEEAQKHNPDIIGLSALLTTTMVNMKEAIDALKAANVSSKILVGGAPVTQNFSDEIGADGYAADAASAIDVAVQVMQ